MAWSEVLSGKSPLAADGTHRGAVGGSGPVCLGTACGENLRGDHSLVELRHAHRSVMSLVTSAVTGKRRRSRGAVF